MEQDMLAYLPPEIIIDILSRLPFPTIMRFKRVCRSWLSLIGTHELIMSYFRNSSFPHGLALFQDETLSKPLQILEFLDKGTHHDELPITKRSAYPCKVESSLIFSFSFGFPHHDMIIHSSVNGLLFLKSRNKSPHVICNPITREYIKLPPPNEASYLETYGFGASKLTGQYKVVRLFRQCPNSSFKCEVYTVGTGSWRSIAADVPLMYSSLISKGVFFKGNLHWLGRSSDRILCFDLETERFSTFSTPVLVGDSDRICALGDCFYLCGNSYRNDNTVIWLLNEYGDDKSWRKERVTRNPYPPVVPIKFLRDGDILFADDCCRLKIYNYSSQTKFIQEIMLPASFGGRVVRYTPSFLQLKTFAMENVSSF